MSILLVGSMAIFLVGSIANKKSKALKIVVKALERMLLLVGLISILIMVKGAIVMSYSSELVSSSLLGFGNFIRCFFSSTIFIIMILMILLIVISFSFHRHHENDNLDDHENYFAHDNLYVQSIKSPPPEASRTTIPSNRVIRHDHDVQSTKWRLPPPSAPPLPTPLSQVITHDAPSTKSLHPPPPLAFPPPPNPPSQAIRHDHDAQSNKWKPSPPPVGSSPSTPRSCDRAEVVTTTTTNNTSLTTTSTKILSQPKKTSHDKVKNLCIEKPNFSFSTINLQPHEIKKTPYPLTKSSEPTNEKTLKSNIIDSLCKQKEILQVKKDEITLDPSKDSGNEDEYEDTLEATWRSISGGRQENTMSIHHDHDAQRTKPRLSPSSQATSPPPNPRSYDIVEAATTTKTIITKNPIRAISAKNLPEPKKTHYDKVQNLSTEKPNLSSSTIDIKPQKLKQTSHPSAKVPKSMKEKMSKPNTLESTKKHKERHLEKKDETTLNPSKDSGDTDTMDATWEEISGRGKEKTKKKELKKSETWDVPPRRRAQVQRLDSEEVIPSSPKWKELRNSESFNDAVSITRRGGLRRDPSTSLDELHKRVEAFIMNFKGKLRLQRQESYQRFLYMNNKAY